MSSFSFFQATAPFNAFGNLGWYAALAICNALLSLLFLFLI
jgi:hypothetical protein